MCETNAAWERVHLCSFVFFMSGCPKDKEDRRGQHHAVSSLIRREAELPFYFPLFTRISETDPSCVVVVRNWRAVSRLLEPIPHINFVGYSAYICMRWLFRQNITYQVNESLLDVYRSERRFMIARYRLGGKPSMCW